MTNDPPNYYAPAIRFLVGKGWTWEQITFHPDMKHLDLPAYRADYEIFRRQYLATRENRAALDMTEGRFV